MIIAVVAAVVAALAAAAAAAAGERPAPQLIPVRVADGRPRRRRIR